MDASSLVIFEKIGAALGLSKIIEAVVGNKVDRAKIENKAYETLLSAQLEVEKKKIESGETKLVLPKFIDAKIIDANKEKKSDPYALANRTEPTIDMTIFDSFSLHQEKRINREHKNLFNSLLLAYDELSREENTSNPNSESKEIPETEQPQFDEDWIWRWREHASQASQDYMRMIWAKILAGEIKNPNSFSLRTLDIISGLSKSDAERLSKIRDFIFSTDCLFFPNSSLFINNTKIDLTFNDILWLEEIGIINGSSSVTLKKEFSSAVNDFYCSGYTVGNRTYFCFNSSQSLKIQIKICVLTTSAKEILNLLELGVNDAYDDAICNEFLNKGCSVYSYIGTARNFQDVMVHDLHHHRGPRWNFIENKQEQEV